MHSKIHFITTEYSREKFDHNQKYLQHFIIHYLVMGHVMQVLKNYNTIIVSQQTITPFLQTLLIKEAQAHESMRGVGN